MTISIGSTLFTLYILRLQKSYYKTYGRLDVMLAFLFLVLVVEIKYESLSTDESHGLLGWNGSIL